MERVAESQRKTKKLLLGKSNNSYKGKNFFAFTFGFFYARIATNQKEKLEIKNGAILKQ